MLAARLRFAPRVASSSHCWRARSSLEDPDRRPDRLRQHRPWDRHHPARLGPLGRLSRLGPLGPLASSSATAPSLNGIESKFNVALVSLLCCKISKVSPV